MRKEEYSIFISIMLHAVTKYYYLQSSKGSRILCFAKASGMQLFLQDFRKSKYVSYMN